MSGKQRKIWVVILAGGDGRRLGALTTDVAGVSTPKQYCSLDGGPSLLHFALQRARGLVPRERIVPVVTESHRRWWEPELMVLRRSRVVVQPSNRGTGLAVILPLLVIAKLDPDAAVICLPSDHYVEHEDVLAEILRQATAAEVVDSDKLTLLGMQPNEPDCGFGYITPSGGPGGGMRPVLKFVEKPDPITAAELIRAGSVWNSGIVAGRIAQIISLYPRLVPGLMLDLKAVVEYWPDSRTPSAELATLYTRHPRLDFSSDILANHASHLQYLTVPPCGWSDVATPARLATALRSRRARHVHRSTNLTHTFNLARAFDRASLTPDWSPEATAAVIRSKDHTAARRDGPLISGTIWTRRPDEG